ncbi:hypothetical protein ALC53_01265 [Atta colombica]|uniref:Uncharacterized protein n=1 Tax=Atta colombica TaxID=520822 RepID=A0A195BUF1_9HYME|nr:hypothetical protein ALC53_01265 [Atta colombica]
MNPGNVWCEKIMIAVPAWLFADYISSMASWRVGVKGKRVNEVYVNNEGEEMNTSECCSASANGGCNARWRDPKIIPSSITPAEAVECPTGRPIIVKPPSTSRLGFQADVKEQNPQKKKKKVSHREMERSRKRKKTEKLVLQYAVKLEHVGGVREELLDFSIFFHSSISARPFLPFLYCFFLHSGPPDRLFILSLVLIPHNLVEAIASESIGIAFARKRCFSNSNVYRVVSRKIYDGEETKHNYSAHLVIELQLKGRSSLGCSSDVRPKRRLEPEAGMEKEKEEVERRGLEWRRKVLERRGNIVLNRKIGILINTRGLSIKGREKRVPEGMRKEEGRIVER